MCVVFSVPANLILRILEAECCGSRLIIGKHWIRSLHPIIRHQIRHHITTNKRVFCKSGYIHIFLNDFLSLSVHIVDFSVVVVVGNNWRTLDMFSAMFQIIVHRKTQPEVIGISTIIVDLILKGLIYLRKGFAIVPCLYKMVDCLMCTSLWYQVK